MAEAPPSCDLAIIGAGVGGCALAAQLRRLGWGGSIQLLEIGRGPGGRAATRRSRHDAELAINHGAPLFNISGEPPALLEPLERGGWIERSRPAIASLAGDGRITAASAPGGDAAIDGDPPGFLGGSLWRGRGGMDQLCRGLLELAAAAETAGPARLQARYGTLVRRLEPCLAPEGTRTAATTATTGWRLHDGDGAALLRCRWLVLSGSLLAHPRCRRVFGWPDVPLQQAIAPLEDPALQRAARHLAEAESHASSQLLLTLSADQAAPWLALPWQLLQCSPAAQRRWGLRRVSIQPLPAGRCAVVAESSPDFAEAHRQVYGSRSSAARLLGAAPEAAAEEATLDALQAALKEATGLVLGPAARQLMRWGAAFPRPESAGLPVELQLCPASRIGFCGDGVAVASGHGRIEGALRSAETLAPRLLTALAATGAH